MLQVRQKSVIGLPLLILMIYGLALIYNYHKQQLNVSTGVKLIYKQQQQQLNLPASMEIEKQAFTPNSMIKINEDLIDIATISREKFILYVKNLSSSQVKDLVRQMGISDLTSNVAQKQFVTCTIYVLSRRLQLQGQQLYSSIQLPPSRQHCKNMSFKTSGPTVALVSYPGSGNSWVRQLLESSTGVYTGAQYCDPSYVTKGLIGEGLRTNNVIAVKTHEFPDRALSKLHHIKAIYVVRSPFGAILSEHNRLNTHGSHTREVNYNFGMYTYIASNVVMQKFDAQSVAFNAT